MKSLALFAWVRIIGLLLALLSPNWWLALIAVVLLLGTGDQDSPIKLGLNKSTPKGRFAAVLFADGVAFMGIAMVGSGYLRILSTIVAFALLVTVMVPKYVLLARDLRATKDETQS